MNHPKKLQGGIGSLIRRNADKYGTWLARNPERGRLKQWVLSKLFIVVVAGDKDPFYGESW